MTTIQEILDAAHTLPTAERAQLIHALWASDRALETIASDPPRFPQCDNRHHYYLMRHFSYQIVYRQHTGHWVVIAVAHTARQPRYWSTR